MYIVRKSVEFWININASTEDEALEIAEKIPDADWFRAEVDAEAEPHKFPSDVGEVEVVFDSPPCQAFADEPFEPFKCCTCGDIVTLGSDAFRDDESGMIFCFDCEVE